MNNALPALALSRSILPNTSSGQLGGAKRANWFSTRCKFENGGVRLEQPFGGSFGGQINGQENAHGLAKIAANRILRNSRSTASTIPAEHSTGTAA